MPAFAGMTILPKPDKPRAGMTIVDWQHGGKQGRRNRRRGHRRAHRRAGADPPRHRGRRVRAGAGAEGAGRRRADFIERHARALCARPRRGDREGRRGGRRQGNPALEHRADLEAVRPRRGVGRALRLPLHDVPSRRPACRAARRDTSRAAGRDPSQPQMHRRHAGRRRRHDRVRNRRTGARVHRRSAPTACSRACGLRCSAPTGRSSPASWRGADSFRAIRCRLASSSTSAPTGSGRAATWCTIRCAAAQLLNFVGLLERDDWRVESWTVQGTKDEFANDFRNWNPD